MVSGSQAWWYCLIEWFRNKKNKRNIKAHAIIPPLVLSSRPEIFHAVSFSPLNRQVFFRHPGFNLSSMCLELKFTGVWYTAESHHYAHNPSELTKVWGGRKMRDKKNRGRNVDQGDRLRSFNAPVCLFSGGRVPGAKSARAASHRGPQAASHEPTIVQIITSQESVVFQGLIKKNLRNREASS